jgi:hypothetical protein
MIRRDPDNNRRVLTGLLLFIACVVRLHTPTQRQVAPQASCGGGGMHLGGWGGLGAGRFKAVVFVEVVGLEGAFFWHAA